MRKTALQFEDKPAFGGSCNDTPAPALNGGNEFRLRLRGGLLPKRALAAASLLFVLLPLLLAGCAGTGMQRAVDGHWAVDYEATRALNPYLRDHRHLRDMADGMILAINARERRLTYTFAGDAPPALTAGYTVLAESGGQLTIQLAGNRGPIGLTMRLALKDGLLTCIVPESEGRDDLVFRRVGE